MSNGPRRLQQHTYRQLAAVTGNTASAAAAAAAAAAVIGDAEHDRQTAEHAAHTLARDHIRVFTTAPRTGNHSLAAVYVTSRQTAPLIHI